MGTEITMSILNKSAIRKKLTCFLPSLCRVCMGHFSSEATVTGDTYLEMLRNWLMPQLRKESEDFVFQQDGSTPHFQTAVRTHLTEQLTNRWIGRAGQADSPSMKWPPRSPDLQTCYFFLWEILRV